MRFTIRRLIAVVAFAAVLLWLLHAPQRRLLGISLGGLALAVGCWAAVRGHCRRAAIGFGISILAANVLVASLSVYQQGWGWIGEAAGIFCGIPMILGFGTAWALALPWRDRFPRDPWPLPVLILTLTMAVTPLATLLSSWPLRLAFLVSRPALESLADRVAAGQAPTFPTRAGLFRIAGSAIDPATGNVALITDPNPNHPSGFVRYQLGTPHRPFDSPFMGMSLSPAWAFEVED